jgi:hypothetical protein
MQQNLIISILLSSAIAFPLSGCNSQTEETTNTTPTETTTTNTTNTTTSQITFICGKEFDATENKKVDATLAWNQTDKQAIIQWKTDYFKDSGFDPKTRCEDVSPRFQKALDEGRLNYLTSGNLEKPNGDKSGETVICAVGDTNTTCNDSNLLFTLREGDKADAIINQLRGALEGETTNPVQHDSYIKVNLDQLFQKK